MAVTPTWQAATTGQPARAGHINQFLGTHQATILYSGGANQVDAQTTGSGVYSSSQSTWLDQRFTMGVGQTTIGYVLLQLATVGGSPTLPLINPITVSVYASSSGLPTGPALASTTVSNNYVYSAPFWVTIPLPVTGLTPSTPYHLVTQAVGTSSHYYTWQHSNQVTGASTSPDGVTWTAQAFGLMFQVFDLSGTTGPPQFIYEDGANRWTQLTYTSKNQIAGISEYTAAEGPAGGYFQSSRSLSYSNGLVTGVS